MLKKREHSRDEDNPKSSRTSPIPVFSYYLSLSILGKTIKNKLYNRDAENLHSRSQTSLHSRNCIGYTYEGNTINKVRSLILSEKLQGPIYILYTSLVLYFGQNNKTHFKRDTCTLIGHDTRV